MFQLTDVDYTFILQQPCWWKKNVRQPIFPYNIIENAPTSLAHNSSFNGQNTFKFGTETNIWSYRSYQSLEEIEHNLQIGSLQATQILVDFVCPTQLFASTTILRTGLVTIAVKLMSRF